jgi:hypothetical protein
MVCERIFLLHLDTAFLLTSRTTSPPKKFYGPTRRRLYGSHLVVHNGPNARVSLACRVCRQRPATGVTQGKLFLCVLNNVVEAYCASDAEGDWGIIRKSRPSLLVIVACLGIFVSSPSRKTEWQTCELLDSAASSCQWTSSSHQLCSSKVFSGNTRLSTRIATTGAIHCDSNRKTSESAVASWVCSQT